MSGPHQNQPLEHTGDPLHEAEAAVVLVHGRGATAKSILEMAAQFDRNRTAYLAPQAARNTWYPNSFLAPIEANEPGRSSGLEAVGNAIGEATAEGIPTDRVVLVGFSQGACLASEYVSRNPRQYGGLAALSGGLIGENIDPANYQGDLADTPVFLGCSDVDPHIPEQRVHETATVFDRLNASVRTRIYEGMGHTVNQDEIATVSSMIDDVLETTDSSVE
ncbi:MAG: alpha/beta hydrolase [Halodesulfurarchaeum sp.]